MQAILFSLALLISSVIYGQMEITLYGDSTEEGIIRLKEKFESKGFQVNVLEKRQEKAEDESNTHPFVLKWTGKKLPALRLVTLDGKMISTEELRGKNIHINMWSTTCKPCIEEFPELNQLKDQYSESWVFLAVAPESADKVRKVVQKHPLAYSTIAGQKDLFADMGVEGYPKNLFVDPEGIIRKVTDGTHYKLGEENGEIIMIPDNYRIYDEIMKNFKLNK